MRTKPQISRRIHEMARRGRERSIENEKERQARLDRLIEASDSGGISLDILYQLSKGLDEKSFTILECNASRLPQYMKSKPAILKARIAGAQKP